MKILIYTDLHCSYTSSILPINCKDSIYTTRLNMIVNTGKWIAGVASEYNVDYIVNGGDTYDSTSVRSEEITAMSEFFSYFDESIPHIIIAGNHEILDIDAKFHASSAFSHMKNVRVYNKPCKINDTISVLPYMKSSDVTNDILKSISNKFLISHIDVKGSTLRDAYVMEDGVTPDLLAEYFEFIANGHLHTAEIVSTSKNTLWNIGGVSSISFVDNDKYIPSICIYDTESRSLVRINNPYAILFRKVTAMSIRALRVFLKNIDKSYKYVLRVSCPYDIRESVRDILSKEDSILTYRVISTASNNIPVGSGIVQKINGNRDMKIEFLEYVNKNSDSLNYPIELYREVISEI